MSPFLMIKPKFPDSVQSEKKKNHSLKPKGGRFAYSFPAEKSSCPGGKVSKGVLKSQ